jgi:mitogen-activated protein kinase 1/3
MFKSYKDSNLNEKQFKIRKKPKSKQVEKQKTSKTSWVSGETKFVVDKKYEYIKCIGRGAYGVVCSALNKETGEKVAIKKVPNAYEDLIDAKRIVREILLLKFFDHENLIALCDLDKPE